MNQVQALARVISGHIPDRESRACSCGARPTVDGSTALSSMTWAEHLAAVLADPWQPGGAVVRVCRPSGDGADG